MTSASASAVGRRPGRLPLPSQLDVALAGVFVVLTTSEALLGGGPRALPVHLAVTGVAMAALAWRRHFPLLVALLVLGANFIVNPDGQFSTLLALVLVSYSIGAYANPPRDYLGLATMGASFTTAMVIEGLVPSDLGAVLVFVVGPWGVGRVLRQRSEFAAAAVSRADSLVRDREAQTQRAVAEERTRIARELHDVVSHSISVVTIQTQAVRRRLRPDQEREAADLAAVEATARQALAEMRRLFGVLRADGETASLTPQPGLAELDRLVAGADSPDLVVRLAVHGEPYPLAPGVDLAAYRIAQEGLTNALRHSGASRVDLEVRYEPKHLEVAVTDDGLGLSDAAPGADGGSGLVGIQERVALYSGTVALGPANGRGTRLVARLPVREPS